MLTLIDLEDLLLLRGIGERTIRKLKSVNLVDLQQKWEVEYAKKYFEDLLNDFRDGVKWIKEEIEEFDLELEEDNLDQYWPEDETEEEI